MTAICIIQSLIQQQMAKIILYDIKPCNICSSTSAKYTAVYTKIICQKLTAQSFRKLQ